MHTLSASDSSNFLAGITNRVPRADLRQFLSDLPLEYLRERLTQIAPDITQDGFLNQLPLDSVNQVLDAMPEQDMFNFMLNVVPSDIRDRIFTASQTTTRLHWIN